MACPLCEQKPGSCDCAPSDFLAARVTALEERLGAMAEDDMTVAEAKATIMRRFNETEERLARLEDHAPIVIPDVDAVIASIQTMVAMKRSDELKRVLDAVKEAVTPNYGKEPSNVQMLIIRDPMGELGRFRIRHNGMGLFIHQIPGRDEWEMEVWPRRPGDFNQSQRDKDHARFKAAMFSAGFTTEDITAVEEYVQAGDLMDAVSLNSPFRTPPDSFDHNEAVQDHATHLDIYLRNTEKKP